MNLDDWYNGVQQQPIAEWSAPDLSLAVRQRLRLRELVPQLIQRLQQAPATQPLVQRQRDVEEAFEALATVESSFWREHREAARGLGKLEMSQAWRKKLAPMLAVPAQIVRGDERVWITTGADVIVGSAPHATLQMQGVGVAREHVRVRWTAEGYVAFALGQPIIVSGVSVADKVVLKSGDEIAVGEATIRFEEQA